MKRSKRGKNRNPNEKGGKGEKESGGEVTVVWVWEESLEAAKRAAL